FADRRREDARAGGVRARQERVDPGLVQLRRCLERGAADPARPAAGSGESRQRQFQRMRDMGVAGLKIDFFGGDGSSMIAYYLDLLEETAAYGLQLNFHGATLPRGWQRTWPHLQTVEAVRGLEFATFEQGNADRVPEHAATLPFVRGVFDPMDFTPLAMVKLNDRVQRRTSPAF